MKKIYIASDHAGLELKNKLVNFLETGGYIIQDIGAYSYDPQDDYPDFVSKVAEEVSRQPDDSRGIIIGGSGQGEAMVANRYLNVRATVFYSPRLPIGAADISGRKSDDLYEIIKLAREHNNSNILSLAARFLTEDEAKTAVKLWLEIPFSGEERHIRRINKLEKLTTKTQKP